MTTDQVLQQGVAAHKEGKLQDAERFYRAILQLQPNHPDANHNLGVLAVSVGKPLEAIPLLKLALKANPSIEQFWLSYLDVLIKLERVAEFESVLADAKEVGVAPDIFIEEEGDDFLINSDKDNQLNYAINLFQS